MGVTLVQLLPHPFLEMCESPCLLVLRQDWCFFLFVPYMYVLYFGGDLCNLINSEKCQ